MRKIIWLLKRKNGMTLENFRDHYERSHAELTHKYIGHLLIGYCRNYKTETAGGAYFENGGFAPFEWEYDCISEFTLIDQAAVDELFRIFSDPDTGNLFFEDELKFMDRERTIMVACDVVDDQIRL